MRSMEVLMSGRNSSSQAPRSLRGAVLEFGSNGLYHPIVILMGFVKVLQVGNAILCMRSLSVTGWHLAEEI